jgi:DNA-binding transcriptional MerR regulator
VDLLSIGEFARRSRLSPKALRLYDELGLLPPAPVDDASGYRYYTAPQLDRARLIAALRQLQIPLVEIKSIVDLEPSSRSRRPRPAEDGWTRGGRLLHMVGHSDDSDGPLEWCRPVPAGEAGRLALEVPERVLRNEPAHREAFIDLGPGGQPEPAQWQLIAQSLQTRAQEHRVQPTELGPRITYPADATVPEGQGPDCDFALPIK